ncbi:unnamed protein product [Somion occarium]|uniref:DUF6534 domain-containing protein n=1 Tax=Somion occarium TaxID=3059160 RepID=A0ABP1D7E4_9APHY
MADPSASAPTPSISELMGGMVMTICISLIFYGVTTAQAYVYYLNSKRDSPWIKTLVASVWIFETIHTAVVLRFLYYMVIISFGNPQSLALIDWSLGVMCVSEVLILALVEGFYIYRIWILSKRLIILTVPLVVLLIARLGFTLSTAVYGLLARSWDAFQHTFSSSFSVLMACSFSAVVDGLIAICMMILLRHKQTGFNRTDNVLRWIMAYSVNTGAISMVVSIVIAITYSTMQDSLLFVGLVILTGKLYANSLLGMLNARALMRQKANKTDSGLVELPTFNNRTTSICSHPTETFQQKTQEGADEIIKSNTSGDEDQDSVDILSTGKAVESRGVHVRIEVQHGDV